MTVLEELAKVAPAKHTAITIGTFDGVHLGHQHLLRHLKSSAIHHGLIPGVLTFRNHPRSVLNPEAGIKYITSLEERTACLRGEGIDLVVGLDFTEDLSKLSAREFSALLVDLLKMRGLIVGPDFAMGHKRAGTIPVLEQLGFEMDFWVQVVDPVLLNEKPVRSSAVRSAIIRGDVAVAAQLLGRTYSLTGTVVYGERRGTQLGFPTANLRLDPTTLAPEDGIYATWAIIDGKRCLSATNVGVRPTFGSGPKTVEAFIMDFDQNIYGKTLTLEFISRLREELNFSTVDELIQQMKLDVDQARMVLTEQHTVQEGSH